MTKVYIIGPSSDGEETKELFNAKEAFLTSNGYLVVNPIKIKEKLDKYYSERKVKSEEYATACLPELLKCSHVTLIDGWDEFPESLLEHKVAKATGKVFLKVSAVKF